MNYREYIDQLGTALRAIPTDEIDGARQAIERAFTDGRTVFVAGNGGSAATASHMVCDFQKTTLGKKHEGIAKRIRCIGLTDNTPLITAWGNDVSYDDVFAQQLRNLANPHDVLLVITASGNSPNIVNALQAATELDVFKVGFLGFGGGKALALCDHSVLVPSTDYGIVEDAHSVLMHMLTAALRETILV